MTTEELLALIDSDSIASGMVTVGDDSGCAARCVQIAPLVRTPVSAADLQYEAMLGMSWGVMKVKASQADVSLEIRALCYQFIDQVQSGRPIDFALPQVGQMLAAMVASEIVSEATSNAIIARSWTPQTITADDVSAAMASRRTGGKI